MDGCTEKPNLGLKALTMHMRDPFISFSSSAGWDLFYWSCRLELRGCWRQLPSELAPLEDRSMVGLAVIAPEGTSYESMEETMKEINKYVSDSIPDLNENRTYAGIAASVGTLVQPVNGGFQWIFLEDPKDRKSGMTQQQIYEKLVAASQRFRNVIIIPIQIPTIGGFSSSQPLQYVVQAPDLESLIDVMPKFMGGVYQSQAQLSGS